MEHTKKRHNPPITKEDLAIARSDQAVKAFDRNNDAVPQKLSIEEAIAKAEKEDVKFEKGEKGAKQEFESLIRRVYGVDFDTASKFDGSVFGAETAYYAKGYQCSAGFFSKVGVLILPAYTKIQTSRKNENVPLIYAGGQYKPITISVYDARFWKQSQTFAKAFEYLSGQKATLVKEFHEEEVKDEKLEEIVHENETEALEGLKVSEDTKVATKKAQKHFRNILNTLLTDKYRIKRTLNDLDFSFSINDKQIEFNVYARKTFFGLKLDVRVARIKRGFDWSRTSLPSPLKITVYKPKELISMGEFAKKYKAQMGFDVELVKAF